MAENAVALTIAGSDSSGAAGVQADLKTFHQLGVYGTSAVTLVSAQHAGGVDAAQPVAPDVLSAQIAAVCSEFSVAALKTGALGSADNVAATAAALRRHAHGPVVVDPVLHASAGDPLLGIGGVEALRDELLPGADLFTPNLPEVEALLGVCPRGDDARERAARALCALGPRAVLIKGGHAEGAECADYLFDGTTGDWLRAPRLDTRHTRGTGCTYAAAIAAHLARGAALREAVRRAHGFVQRAIAGAPGARPSAGARGPLDHWAKPA